uniref:Si:dkey-83k24.5 n=1 Tax=Sinocyclocheilus rhinocerous TaxID=307959 RepID=A0A673LW45_9TELE
IFAIKIMKFISLVILVIQDVSLILSISYVWTLSDFLATSAVVMAEILKVVACLFIIFEMSVRYIYPNFSISK